MLCIFQYLKRGCTQFFCNKATEKLLSEDRKSQAQKRKGPLRDPILDDVKDFSAVDKALSNLGINPQDRLAIYTTVAAVLHLGNIHFEDNPEDVRGTFNKTQSLIMVVNVYENKSLQFSHRNFIISLLKLFK